MDFSANLYNSKMWILDTVQKVLLSTAKTEKRKGERLLKKPHNSAIENQNSEKSPAKPPSIFDFYISKSDQIVEMAFFVNKWTRVMYELIMANFMLRGKFTKYILVSGV